MSKDNIGPGVNQGEREYHDIRDLNMAQRALHKAKKKLLRATENLVHHAALMNAHPEETKWLDLVRFEKVRVEKWSQRIKTLEPIVKEFKRKSKMLILEKGYTPPKKAQP